MAKTPLLLPWWGERWALDVRNGGARTVLPRLPLDGRSIPVSCRTSGGRWRAHRVKSWPEQLQQKPCSIRRARSPSLPPSRGLLNMLFYGGLNCRQNPISFRLDWNNQLNKASVTLRVANLGIRKNSRGYSVN